MQHKSHNNIGIDKTLAGQYVLKLAFVKNGNPNIDSKDIENQN